MKMWNCTARITCSVPQVLVLNDCGIDQAGKAEELRKKCNSVKELDLAQNKLENWNEVRFAVDFQEFLLSHCQVGRNAIDPIFTFTRFNFLK